MKFNFFKKKNQDESTTTIRELNNEKYLANDFLLRNSSFYVMYLSENYTLTESFEANTVQRDIDCFIEKIRSGIDDANGPLLDNVLLTRAFQALNDLQMQQISHNEVIQRLIARRRTDKQDIEHVRDQILTQIENLKEQHKETCQRIENNKI